MFLHRDVIDEVKERLSEVNRRFTAPAVVTPFPALWQGVLPDARVVGEAEVLDLAPGAHDLVVHALALHWAEDPVGQLVQSRLALRPDGLFLAATFGGRSLAELRAVLAETEVALTGGLSPRVLPMAEIRDLGALLQRAGFALPVADSTQRKIAYRDLPHLMADLRAMGEANALAARLRHPTRRAFFGEAARRYAESFSEGDRIMASVEIVWLTAWAPHPAQQKPLRPGSAARRLADALGASEFRLPESGGGG